MLHQAILLRVALATTSRPTALTAAGVDGCFLLGLALLTSVSHASTPTQSVLPRSVALQIILCKLE